MDLGIMGLGPMEIVAGLICLGVVAVGVTVLVLFLVKPTKSEPDRLSRLEEENRRLRMELENQKLKDAIQKRDKKADF